MKKEYVKPTTETIMTFGESLCDAFISWSQIEDRGDAGGAMAKEHEGNGLWEEDEEDNLY